MKKRVEKVISQINLKSGASFNEIEKAQLCLHITFPEDYKEFLLRSNGAEGIVGKAYLVLWSVEEIIKLNEEYSVERFAPGLLLFGTDGGDEAYGFDTKSEMLPIVNVPFVSMSRSEIRFIGSTFDEFLISLSEQEKDQNI
jgi:hypothetical protein